MLMVLNLHSFWGYDHGSGLGQFFDFFRESASICAVNVFLLISGYFGIRWKLKGLYSLLFQVVFYAFGVYMAAVSIGLIDYSTSDLLQNFKCLYANWNFISKYVLLYLFAPLLNVFSENVTKKHLLLYLLVMFVWENFIGRSFIFTNYCLMYLIGRWLNRTDSVNNLKVSPYKIYIIVTLLISILSYMLCVHTPINTAERMCGFILGYDYQSPFVILQSVALFLIFARMDFTNKYINWCASSCLAIFLIHMHPAINEIWYYSITESMYNLPLWEHVLNLSALIFCVFFGAILVDKVRIIISELFFMILRKITNSLPQKLWTIDFYIPKVIKDLI